MANDLPPNLDDGELWLPSDVIRAVGVCRHNHRRADFAFMDSLAQKLAAFGLLERRRAIHAVKPFRDLPPNPEFQFHGQGRSVGYKAPTGRRPASGDVVYGAGGGTGAFFPVSRAVHKFHPGIPVDAQVDELQLERARFLQRQNQSLGLNRYLPTRAKSSGRESGGTGVFIPRTVSVDSRKKPLSMKKGSVQFQQRQPKWNPMPGQRAANFLPPSEICLPHDWTY
ncbi:hypothetical protein KSP40_PGU020843 [Platanthera guangdongensis]|uniref:Uncharacterized protein n=1 Tax=Platanthera guangdongensis TaxID=2320717 RepID=A0ABR2M6S5_9ASPA